MTRARKMTVLEAYAHHGSISYGKISAPRLKEILLGDAPNDDESPCVFQALMEMHGALAFDLAVELGISYDSLNNRALILCEQSLPR